MPVVEVKEEEYALLHFIAPSPHPSTLESKDGILRRNLGKAAKSKALLNSGYEGPRKADLEDDQDR